MASCWGCEASGVERICSSAGLVQLRARFFGIEVPQHDAEACTLNLKSEIGNLQSGALVPSLNGRPAKEPGPRTRTVFHK
jgi:hypothetical protein